MIISISHYSRTKLTDLNTSIRRFLDVATTLL